MNRSFSYLVLTAIVTGLAVLFAMLAIAFTPVLFVAAIPLGIAAALLWVNLSRRTGVRRRRVPKEPVDGAETKSEPQYRVDAARRRAYDILGVPPGVDDERLKEAYRKRVKETHPDRTDGTDASFRAVTDAYRLLRDRR